MAAAPGRVTTSMMALALSRAGLRVAILDPHEMGLVAEGSPLDSDLIGLDAKSMWAKIDANDIVVLPGFIADNAEHGVVTLGRGGTDLSAVFFADQLDAHRVRLIKDVDGVYEEDPARNPNAHRYEQLNYSDAEQASTGLIQAKAIRTADEKSVLIQVAALGSAQETTIARLPALKARPARPERLKVALLGCGAVGAGVLELLQSHPNLFEVGPVLVRNPDRHERVSPSTRGCPSDCPLEGRPRLVRHQAGRGRPGAGEYSRLTQSKQI